MGSRDETRARGAGVGSLDLVLTVNCGSTSRRVDLFRTRDDTIDHVRSFAGSDAASDVGAVAESLLRDAAADAGAGAGADRMGSLAVGHRVVHGGERFVDPIVIDEPVIAGIRKAGALAPLHNTPALAAIDRMRAVLGADVPMVAVFDTAFHAGVPDRAARYAIEHELTQRHGLRRFGFHGLAHRSMLERAGVVLGRPPHSLRLVTFQLGGGCSAAAIDSGRSIDVSMGLTPVEGLVMATRSGDVDPTLVTLVARLEGVDPTAIEERLNTRSGLLGLSGRSGDMRELLAAERTDPAAALAVEMFCYRARKYLGAYLAALGGADAVVFGGGIGEHAPAIRARICQDLEWAGIEIDDHRNTAAAGIEARIDAGSGIAVLTTVVDEAALIARDTVATLRSAHEPG